MLSSFLQAGRLIIPHLSRTLNDSRLREFSADIAINKGQTASLDTGYD